VRACLLMAPETAFAAAFFFIFRMLVMHMYFLSDDNVS
jgi:hypothetical protein